jgi:hypothetical protein
MLGRPASAGTTERSLIPILAIVTIGSLDTHTKALKLRQVYTRLDYPWARVRVVVSNPSSRPATFPTANHGI